MSTDTTQHQRHQGHRGHRGHRDLPGHRHDLRPLRRRRDRRADRIPGVLDVHVDVPTGQVTVTSTAPLTTADVRNAIDEAGYQLA